MEASYSTWYENSWLFTDNPCSHDFEFCFFCLWRVLFSFFVYSQLFPFFRVISFFSHVQISTFKKVTCGWMRNWECGGFSYPWNSFSWFSFSMFRMRTTFVETDFHAQESRFHGRGNSGTFSFSNECLIFQRSSVWIIGWSHCGCDIVWSCY